MAHFSCISGRSSGPFIGYTPAGARKQDATVRGKLVTFCGMVDLTKLALLFFIWYKIMHFVDFFFFFQALNFL